MPIVHAIIPHHRGKAMLEECLESLLASKGIDLEIVLVLNGCDEEIPEVFDAVPNVHTMRPEVVLGFAEANNVGVAFAREQLGEADYYYFLNNDTLSEADALAKLVNELERTPEAAIAGPMLLIQWAPDYLNSLGLLVTEDAWGWDNGIGKRLAEFDSLSRSEDVIAVTGCALLMKAKIFREVRGWSEIYDYYFEDIDLCLKARQSGYQVLFCSEAVVYHQVSATMTLESDYKVFLFWRNRLLLAMIHWPISALFGLIKPLLIEGIWSRPRSETEVQRRAARSAFSKFKSVLHERRHRRSSYRNWYPMLQPSGSVPAIILPDRNDNEGRSRITNDDLVEQTMVKRPRRILVLGVCPLPFENTSRSFGPGTRTWQITEPLLADGHTIKLIAMRIPKTYPKDAPPEIVAIRDRFEYSSVDQSVYFQTPYVRTVCEEFKPEAIVFAHGAASYDAAIVDPEVPVWIDLCGHVMAEAQAKACVYNDDSYLDYFFKKILPALFKGDFFSTVSDAQKWALVGELGLVGRLNSMTNGLDFVHTIPCGVEEEAYEKGPTILRGIDVPANAFVILWSGGFNTWTDIDTMFGAVVRAMDYDPSIYFVATGGQIDGHDEKTYPRFVSMIEASFHRDRFVLKGWLPHDLVPSYYHEADVGINCEKDIYEVRLGSKHRILDWSRAGLPVVTTRVTELSDAIEQDGVGFVCAAGDSEGLGDELIAAFEQRADLPAMGERCRQALRRRYGFMASTQALRGWAMAPMFAPDRNRRATCLEVMISGEDITPPESQPDVLTINSGETRLQWLLRVFARSYVVGGGREVIRRGYSYLTGQHRK